LQNEVAAREGERKLNSEPSNVQKKRWGLIGKKNYQENLNHSETEGAGTGREKEKIF